MSKQTSTGVTIAAVKGRPATLDKAGYEALTFTDIGEVTNIPDFGATIQVVESNPLATGVTEKYTGFVNYGSVSIEADYDDEDSGQALATNAVDSGHADYGAEFSFKLTYSSGAIRYWVARFFSATEAPGSANSMVTTTMNVEINTPVLKIPAP